MKEQKNKDKLLLGEEQFKLFNIMEYSMDNMFIQGSAGVGKSTLIKHFVENTTKNVAITASTGVAALNINGQTIHSFFGLGIDIQDINNTNIFKVNKEMREKLKALDTIIIDEISMVSPDRIEAINIKCKIARKSELPFGGIQMIFFGDLYQLPPIISNGLHEYYRENYGGIFFFNAPVIKKNELKIYELKTIYRQTDPVYQEVLNRIRLGVNTIGIMNTINKRVEAPPLDKEYVILTTTNTSVESINNSRLNDIKSEEVIYKANITGDVAKSGYSTDEYLHLKVGAQVMMIQNDSKYKRWVNGSVGIVTELDEKTIKVKIKNEEYIVTRSTWDSYKYTYNQETKQLEKEVVGSFEQFPIKLAWAITIHKSQGKTYDCVYIDFTDGAFDDGQVYVALSRCIALENIYLAREIKKTDIRASKEVKEFMKNAKILDL